MAPTSRPALSLLAAALVLLSCTAADPVAQVQPTPPRVAGGAGPVAATPSATPQPPTPERAAPLLALPVHVDGPAGTLAGLTTADTVVEYARPGAGTAVVVLTREPDAVIGPLRTATARDAAITRAWDAGLVTTLADEAARRRGRVVAEEGAPPGVVVRDPARRAPYNAYAKVERARALSSAGDDAGGAGAGWATGPPTIAAGRPADEVVVAAAETVQARWAYDSRRGAWIRRAGRAGTQAVAQADGLAVAVGTVVVTETAGGAAWRGAGPAVVLRAGRRHTARWVVGAPGTPPALEQADGTPFPVAGTVWLHRCPTPCAQQIAPLTRRPDIAPR